MARDPGEVLTAVTDRIKALQHESDVLYAVLAGGTEEEITTKAHRDAYARVLEIINEEQLAPSKAKPS